MKLYNRGYTTGVFDLFHVGHLNILRRAKEQCRYLVVGVSTDELVQSYKYRAPVIPFVERVEILRAIRYVDEVIPQYSLDKRDAVSRVQFDVLFVGDDWKGTPQWTALGEYFRGIDIDIVYFPYTGHTSSTLLAEAVRRLAGDRARDQK